MISWVIDQSQPKMHWTIRYKLYENIYVLYIVCNCCLHIAEYFYMERITFVKTSLLPSKNDEFHEDAHFFFIKNYLFLKKLPIVIYKKLDAPNSDL